MTKTKIKISGPGMHSGVESTMVVRPTKSGGITFVRNGVKTRATYDNITPSPLRSTVLGRAPNHIQTIEHLMCALYLCQIANVEVKIDNAETPILDGCAVEMVKLLKGVKALGKAGYLRVKKPIIARQSELGMPLWLRIFDFLKGNKKKNAYVRLSPTPKNCLDLTAAIDYVMPVIGCQQYRFVFDYDDFKNSVKRFMKDVAPCRTFGTEAEWEWLKKHGMGRGVNGTNVLAINSDGTDTLNDLYYKDRAEKKRILDKYGYLLPPGFRMIKKHFRDEFVRHKIIDAVGDLYASGFRIIGKFESDRGGHALNNLLLRRLFADPSNYDIIQA